MQRQWQATVYQTQIGVLTLKSSICDDDCCRISQAERGRPNNITCWPI